MFYFSFQQEYPEKLDDLLKEINKWEASINRNFLIDCNNYAEGNNTFINNFKRKIWSDDQKEFVENIFVPNYKTAYGFYENMVNQKNNALYGEMPTINEMDKNNRKRLGFALKSAGKKASIYGYSFIYEKVDGTYKVFETPNCMVYIDDETNAIRRFVRFWHNKINDVNKIFFEVYDEEGISTYVKSEKEEDIQEFIPKQYYKKIINKSSIGVEEQVIAINTIPIAIYRNDEEGMPDLKPNIKMKIDLIDVIQSGLANNIDEFSDVWMSINVPNVTQEDAQKIKETVRRTKMAMFAGSDEKNYVDFKTMQIPYEARAKAIEMLKQELIEDTGVIDFKQISGSATATEINARTYKLQQRVSDFEWFSDECATELVAIWQEYHNVFFEIDITFNKLFIQNKTEIVNNANLLYGKISNRAFLNQLQLAGIIDDVDEEIKEQEAEGKNKFTIVDDEVEDEYSTQPNEQDFVN